MDVRDPSYMLTVWPQTMILCWQTGAGGSTPDTSNVPRIRLFMTGWLSSICRLIDFSTCNSRQTLAQCWPSVNDAGPTLNQRLATAHRLLWGSQGHLTNYVNPSTARIVFLYVFKEVSKTLWKFNWKRGILLYMLNSQLIEKFNLSDVYFV